MGASTAQLSKAERRTSGPFFVLIQPEFSTLFIALMARMAPVIGEFAVAGADFVIESVADLCLAIRAIEDALAKGQMPGATPTRTLIGQPA